MADEQNTQIAVNTQQQAPATQPTAVNVDMESIVKMASEKAEQKMNAVFKSMLVQHGLDAETVNKMSAEWKANQTTPEKEIKSRDETIASLNATIETEKQKNIAIVKGIPLGDETQAEKVNACLMLAKSYVSDTITFEQALDKAITVISFTAGSEQKTGFQASAGASGKGTSNNEDELKKIFKIK